MKLLNLNVGIKNKKVDKVAEFLKEQKADILTLQEVVKHLDNKVFEEERSKAMIEKRIGKFYPHQAFGPLWFTEAFRKNGKVYRDFGGLIEQGNEVLSKFPITEATNEHYYKSYAYSSDRTNWKKEDHERAVQIVELNVKGKKLQILNVHGIWTQDKLGDQRTLDQCKFFIKAAKRKPIPAIIVGDFNLVPRTKSIQLLNKEFRNLIEEFKITTTRPDFKDELEGGRNVVDYIFVNKGIKVKDFKAIKNEVSDHFPLLLDFEII